MREVRARINWSACGKTGEPCWESEAGKAPEVLDKVEDVAGEEIGKLENVVHAPLYPLPEAGHMIIVDPERPGARRPAVVGAAQHAAGVRIPHVVQQTLCSSAF